MTLNEYQAKSKQTALYPKDDRNFNRVLTYPTLGLVGETGELANKVKKIYRDEHGVVSEHKQAELQSELGDVLWYLAQLCTELGVSLEAVATANLAKLYSRQERGVLGGSGDNR